MSLPDGEDFVMRPVTEGMVPYTALLDGTVGLLDIRRMNDALDVRDENGRRMSEHAG